MFILAWILLVAAGLVALAYYKTNVQHASLALISGFLLTLIFSPLPGVILFLLFTLVASILIFIHFPKQRQQFFTTPLLKSIADQLPKMSETETIALQAGTVGFDRELFSGRPNWSKWFKRPLPKLTPIEQNFLDGPVNTLCEMLNEWEISHIHKDLPKEVWDFLKKERFFGIIIPKHYGGLEFSAFAHSEILTKISSCSLTASSTVAVPNSLGPAELIHRYGTKEQKEYYLPRLANGIEIPCFALTNKEAGSDATAIPDNGVICRDLFEGNEVLGIRLNWEKRYITLAPIATLLGLAFKLYDPDHLISDKTNLGITCALVPTHFPGISIGARHKPLFTPFQNGPTTGKNVFIPLDYIIGGLEMAGQGWRMLVECLSTGRAISLPSSASGASKMLTAVSSAYARTRRQFKQPIGKFGGIEEVLASIAGNTFLIDCMRSMTAACIDQNESPSVLGAIAKCYSTEKYRKIASDAMDIQGGKGVMLGPRNYTAYKYINAPISITVEGANILTRSMIIFGQGVMRSHPFIMEEMNALKLNDENESLQTFDRVIMSHISYTINNAAGAFVLGLRSIRSSSSYLPELNRASAAFALMSDISLLILGGKLKFNEKLSGRFSDMLAMMYLASCALKFYENLGRPKSDRPLMDWVIQETLSIFWNQMDELLKNFPNRIIALLLRVIIMPLGKQMSKPSDKLTKELATLVLSPSTTRSKIIHGMYMSEKSYKPHVLLEQAFKKIVASEKEGATSEEVEVAEKLRKELIEVDYFTAEQF